MILLGLAIGLMLAGGIWGSRTKRYLSGLLIVAGGMVILIWLISRDVIMK